ncbi:hypothetical protein [Bradyrhizobium cajani]|uniref:Ternary complex associated domain-containing protein n=1 Tax=Bradyrhizobium cajani TaxID=1928661 RepID=A0A844TG16_9BRAD|nr:hypothetical protein [Bradyrhizobium cajani]MCP3368647.1 ecdysteroid 22-kinase family protein [Bradyrhizobium cajani]MVT73560.1 hypothetical protein [Bradyrhizobium cajani]
MAIREFSPEGRPRAKIAFVGEVPSKEDLDKFRDRSFQCEPSTPAKLGDPAYAAQLDAVIWTQDGNKINALPRQLGSFVPCLLDYDVRVYIRLAADKHQTDAPRKLVVNALLESKIPVANLRSDEWQTIPKSDRERERGFLLPCVYLFDTASSWVDIAALVCDRPASSSPKTALVFDEKVLLDRFGSDGHSERLILLKRAFWNCSELRLTLLDGGMSGAPVFKAYASAEAGLVQPGSTGPYPHLFFVKIGPRKKIIDEYDKYCGHIFEYVPFHLGPRLRRDRCNLGSTLGILVGDFVDGSESLIACARGGRCGHAIANLFDKTLGGWRKQDYIDEKRTLSAFFEDKWQVEGQSQLIELPTGRIPLVQKLGADTSIEALKEIFVDLGNTAPKVAPAHGDMHATNVLIRHGDAILIDFEKLEQHYPLTYDPASLEGGLLVEGFIEDLKKGKLALTELVQLIEPLYEESALKRGQTTFCRPGDPAEWFYNAVNQIRTLSWSAEQQPGQYALTLALCLVRKGCNPHVDLDANEPNMSRAIAFFFGQKLLRAMAKTTAATAGKHKHQSGDAGQ